MASTYTGKVPKDNRKWKSTVIFEDLPAPKPMSIPKDIGKGLTPKPAKHGDDGFDYLKHHKKKFGIKE